jgi:hypothetical protein
MTTISSTFSNVNVGSIQSATMTQRGAIGPMDAWLRCQSQSSLFRGATQLRRITNFAFGDVFHTATGSTGLGMTNTFKVERAGDMIRKVNLCGVLDRLNLDTIANTTTAYSGPGRSGGGTDPNTFISWVPSVGHQMIEEETWQMGTLEFDKHPGEYMQMKHDTFDAAGKDNDALVGGGTLTAAFWGSMHFQPLYIPSRFYFCEDDAFAFPQIALYQHDMFFKFKLRDKLSLLCQSNGYNADGTDLMVAKTSINTTHITNYSSLNFNNVCLMTSYVFLDAAERASFSGTPYEFLYQQLQCNPEVAIAKNTSNSAQSTATRLSFNHPIKRYLMHFLGAEAEANNLLFDWHGGYYKLAQQYDGTDFATFKDHAFYSMTQTLNSHQRLPVLPAKYFHSVVTTETCTKSPLLTQYHLSYALRPELLQCTGVMNHSMIDNVSLSIIRQPIGLTNADISGSEKFTCDTSHNTYYNYTQTQAAKWRIYAENYQVGKLIGGMAGMYFA